MSIPKLFFTTIVLAVATKAAPQMSWSPAFFCPVVDSSEETDGTPWQTDINGPGGSTLSISETHTEGISWTIGGDLGISAGDLSLTGSWSVAESVEDSFGAGWEDDCPEGQWRCSIVITPRVVHAKGHLKEMGPDDNCEVSTIAEYDGGKEGQEFEYDIPIKDNSGNAVLSVELCTCKDREHWADPGHLDLCPEDCGGSK